VGPRAILHVVAKRKVLPCRESNPSHPDPNLLTILTERGLRRDLPSLKRRERERERDVNGCRELVFLC
jgi:hypothetical protein